MDIHNNFSLVYEGVDNLIKANILIFGTKNYIDSKPILITANIQKRDSGLKFNSNIISGEGIGIGVGSPNSNLDFTGFDNYTILTIISNEIIKINMW